MKDVQFDYSLERIAFQNGRQNAINVLGTIFFITLSDNEHFFVTMLAQLSNQHDYQNFDSLLTLIEQFMSGQMNTFTVP